MFWLQENIDAGCLNGLGLLQMKGYARQWRVSRKLSLKARGCVLVNQMYYTIIDEDVRLDNRGIVDEDGAIFLNGDIDFLTGDACECLPRCKIRRVCYRVIDD